MQLQEFFSVHHSPHVETSTADFYRTQLRHLAAWWATQCTEPFTLADLSAEAIYTARAWHLQRGAAKSTADNLRVAVAAIWSKAAELGHAPPCPRLKGLKKEKADPIAWSVADFGAILDAAELLPGCAGPWPLSVWFPALLWCTYNTGARISEVMAIEWRNVALDDRRLHIEAHTTKDNEGRTVTLLPETVEALQAIAGDRCGQLFGAWPFDRGGRQWRGLDRRLRRCIVSAGLFAKADDVTRRHLWHKLRRTFATAAYAACQDIELVREMLGHSDAKTTWEHYIDKSRVHRKTQADLLPTPDRRRLRIADPDDDRKQA